MEIPLTTTIPVVIRGRLDVSTSVNADVGQTTVTFVPAGQGQQNGGNNNATTSRPVPQWLVWVGTIIIFILMIAGSIYVYDKIVGHNTTTVVTPAPAHGDDAAIE